MKSTSTTGVSSSIAYSGSADHGAGAGASSGKPPGSAGNTSWCGRMVSTSAATNSAFQASTTGRTSSAEARRHCSRAVKANRLSASTAVTDGYEAAVQRLITVGLAKAK